MKKAILGFGAMLLAALTAGGCGSEAVPKLEDLQQSVIVDQTESQPQIQRTSESSNEEDTVMETYRAVLRGEQEFVDSISGGNLDISRAKEIFTSDTSIAMEPGQFAVVDMDDDGIPEVVLMMRLNGYPSGSLVLHCEGSTVYGYAFSDREMMDIKMDGSFMASGGAANVEINRIAFDKQVRLINAFISCESHYDTGNNLNIFYYVDHQEVAKAEYDTAYSEWEKLTGVEWHDFTSDNVEGMNWSRASGNAGAAGSEGAVSAQGADSGVFSVENAFGKQILDQSFTVDLDDWGKVTFAAFEPAYLTKEGANGQVMFGDVRFGLIKDGEIIYNFPGYNEENARYSQQFSQVVSVAFRDYDENGRMDILIINEYAGVQGPNTDVPFREARVYTQENGETVFKLEEALSEYLVYYTDSMSEIYKGLESYAKGYSVATSKTVWTVERFAKEIKQFILGGDFEGLCDIISFPVTVDGTVYQDGEAFMKADFVKNPNPQFLEELRAETCENLFANYQGIMMGNGLVWFAEFSNEDRLSARGLKITGINGITVK